MQGDAPAHGTAREDGAVKAKGACHGEDGFDIGVGGEEVFLGLEAFGREGLAMPGHVEGEEAVVCGQARIV